MLPSSASCRSYRRLRARRRRQRAFTLVELLVVVCVIGALLNIALPLYVSSVRTANKGVAKANMHSMFTAAQMIRVKTGVYPTLMSDITAELGLVMDGRPANVTYTIGLSGTNEVLTATDNSAGNGVLGVHTLTYTWVPGDASGTYAP